MKELFAIILACLMLAGCRGNYAPGETVEGGGTFGNPASVKYVHDARRGVGCWVFIDESGSSISCLPDSQYKP